MEILTLKEAAVFLKVAPSYLRELIKRGVLPYRQEHRGCRITFSKEALERWWLKSARPLPVKIKLNLIRRKI
jgi:excisionase family DNA binding protein